MSDFDAVILCGGRSSRLGVNDKSALVVDGVTLIDRAIASVEAAAHVVAVGPARPTAISIEWTVEDPVSGGPVAGVDAGIRKLTNLNSHSELVVLLAADIPFASAAVARLLDAQLTSVRDGTMAVDADGRDQFLLSVWKVVALRNALATVAGSGGTHGKSMKQLINHLRSDRLLVSAAESFDCDTPADLDRARKIAIARST